MAADTIKLFVPTGGVSTAEPTPQRTTAREPQSAFVIGLLDNHKHNTDRILDRLERRLGEHYRDVRFVRAQKPEAGKSASRQLIEDLAGQCQGVINGIGD